MRNGKTLFTNFSKGGPQLAGIGRRGRIDRRQIARKKRIHLPLRKKREHRLCGRTRMQRIGLADILKHPQTAVAARNLCKTHNTRIGRVVACEDRGFGSRLRPTVGCRGRGARS